MRAVVALGSNLGDRLATLRAAAAQLRDSGLRIVAASAIYQTRPLGPSEGEFLNAAVLLETDASPAELLEMLLAIERAHGRVRRERWEARTLDLDLLVAFDEDAVPRTLATETLTLPHPSIEDRDFVLVPLCDLIPNAPVLANGRTPSEALAALAEPSRTIVARLPDALLP